MRTERVTTKRGPLGAAAAESSTARIRHHAPVSQLSATPLPRAGARTRRDAYQRPRPERALKRLPALLSLTTPTAHEGESGSLQRLGIIRQDVTYRRMPSSTSTFTR